MPNYFYVADDLTTGTKTTGASSTTGIDGDWAASNQYANPNTAYDWWVANDGTEAYLVTNTGTITATSGADRFNIHEAGTTGLLHVISRASATTITTTIDNVQLFPVIESTGLSVENLTLTMDNGTDANAEQLFEVQAGGGPVTLDTVTVQDIDWTPALDVTAGLMVEFDDTSSVLTMTDVTVAGTVTVVSAANSSYVNINSGDFNITNLTWNADSTTATFGSANFLINGSANLTWNGGTISGSKFDSTGSAARHGMIRSSSTGVCSLDNITMDSCTFTGNNTAGSAIRGALFGDEKGATSSGLHTIDNSTFSNNSTVNYDNQRGSILALNDGSFFTAKDITVFGNAGWFGPAGYSGAGGGFDIERLLAYDNTSVTSVTLGETHGVVYFGGGATDSSLKAAFIRNNASTRDGVAVYIHNSDTPTTPGARVVTIEHLTTLDNGSGTPISINGLNQPLTVNLINCAFGEIGDIITVGGTTAQITINTTNCAARDSIANLISGTGHTLNETATVVVADGPVNADGTPKAKLLKAGSNTATTVSDINGFPYDADEPHIGAFAVAGGNHFYIAVTRRMLKGPPKKRIMPKARRTLRNL